MVQNNVLERASLSCRCSQEYPGCGGLSEAAQHREGLRGVRGNRQGRGYRCGLYRRHQQGDNLSLHSAHRVSVAAKKSH